MTAEILEWLQNCAYRFDLKPRRVLDVGSRDENGTARSIFQAGADDYIGLDLQAGPGVDVVGEAATVLWGWKWFGGEIVPFDLALCMECLEHDVDPVRTVRAIREWIKPGGYLALSSPGQTFPEHRYPRDYWRLMPDAYRDLLLFGTLVVSHHVTSDPCQCWLAQMPGR